MSDEAISKEGTRQGFPLCCFVFAVYVECYTMEVLGRTYIDPTLGRGLFPRLLHTHLLRFSLLRLFPVIASDKGSTKQSRDCLIL